MNLNSQYKDRRRHVCRVNIGVDWLLWSSLIWLCCVEERPGIDIIRTRNEKLPPIATKATGSSRATSGHPSLRILALQHSEPTPGHGTRSTCRFNCTRQASWPDVDGLKQTFISNHCRFAACLLARRVHYSCGCTLIWIRAHRQHSVSEREPKPEHTAKYCSAAFIFSIQRTYHLIESAHRSSDFRPPQNLSNSDSFYILWVFMAPGIATFRYVWTPFFCHPQSLFAVVTGGESMNSSMPCMVHLAYILGSMTHPVPNNPQL